MRFYQLPALALVLAATLVACNSDKHKTASGVDYVYHKRTSGAESRMAKPGDIITIHVMYGPKGDTASFSSRKAGQPISFPIDKTPIPGQKDPFRECYLALAQGDSATFFIPSDSLFKGQLATQRPPNQPVGSIIQFTTTVLRVETEPAMMARVASEPETYVKASGKEFVKLATGEYVHISERGQGPLPAVGDTVSVDYRGFFVDKSVTDKPFDESYKRGAPFRFLLGRQMAIPGWDHTIATMPEGSKAQIVIPYQQAYGEFGQQGGMPGHANLIFDVHLVKVTKGLGSVAAPTPPPAM